MAGARHARTAWAEILLGLGLLLLSGVVLWGITQIPVSPLYAKIGPTVFPTMTVAGIAACAFLLIIAGLRGDWQSEDEKAVPLDWQALAWVAAGLLANVLLIVPLGFTIASTIMFTLIARGYGSRQVFRDAAIGFALALVAYFGFAKFLGVNIGAGAVERLLLGG